MKINVAQRTPAPRTHEGGPATRPPHAAAELRRAVMACLLWEDSFYEAGVDIAQRIRDLVPQVPAEVVAHFAIKARTDMKLRHVPLLLVREMARGPVAHRLLVAKTLREIIQRADELAEFLAIYWKDDTRQGPKRSPLSAQVKKGLASAFSKFNDYALAKYNRDGAVKLRDALFLSHAKPSDAPSDRRYTRFERKEGKAVALTPGEKRFQALMNDTLPTPDTWEVALSGGADKKEAFERLLAENKLGALALLRNLRNMTQAGISETVLWDALAKMDVTRVLPHRFIAAARAVPMLEAALENPMLEAAKALPKLTGRTLFLIDVSGSMDSPLSAKSDLTRIDAACGLAVIGRELCDQVAVFTFSNQVVQIPARRGFALRDAIADSQSHQGTLLGAAIKAINDRVDYDRLIVITDEQAADVVGPPRANRKGYMLNVASYKNGVGYGPWNKIDGFSEAVLRYIVEFENNE